MKKIILSVLILFVFAASYAQNTFPWPQNANIGIGTSNPLSILNVASGSGSQITFSNLTPTSIGTENQSLVFNGTNNANGGGILELFRIKVISTNGGVARGSVNFFQNGNSSPSLSFLPNGNVGIGTANPASIFNVASGSGSQFTLSNVTPTTAGTENQSLVFNGTNNANGGGELELFRVKVTSTNGGAALGNIGFLQNGSMTPTLTFLPNANVGIGTATPDSKLAVNGTIHSKEVKVDIDSNNWPDFVFDDNYNIISLEDLQHYIRSNRHLPDLPSAGQVEKEGIKLGEMNKKLLKQVEELTLYMIEKDQQLKAQQKINKNLEDRLDQLEKQVNLNLH